jgi:hypothetical protein
MSNPEDWQPVFRFLEKFDESDAVGAAFAVVYLVGVTIAWYWICFRDGAESWREAIILWNERHGLKPEWIMPWVTPFLLKLGISLCLIASVIGLYMALIAKLSTRQ